jgi:hypothetical protein
MSNEEDLLNPGCLCSCGYCNPNSTKHKHCERPACKMGREMFVKIPKRYEVRLPTYAFVLDCLDEIPKSELLDHISNWILWLSELEIQSDFVVVSDPDSLSISNLIHYLGGLMTKEQYMELYEFLSFHQHFFSEKLYLNYDKTIPLPNRLCLRTFDVKGSRLGIIIGPNAWYPKYTEYGFVRTFEYFFDALPPETRKLVLFNFPLFVQPLK